MSSSEFPEFERPDEAINEVNVPDFPVAELELLEALDKWEKAETLAEQMRKMEGLGFQDDNRYSFHHIWEDDSESFVLFGVKTYTGLGKTQHIISNQITSTAAFGRHLDIKEYFVWQDCNNVVLLESWLERGQHDHKWEHVHGTGPVLYSRNEKVEVFRGENSDTWLPWVEVKNYSLEFEETDQKAIAHGLTELLKKLSRATAEPHMPVIEH
ncbi:MAG TPA: hypothetical protein VLE69_00915 [Candidatus Saccharimonadales bacterium]|nr:hypothetical protein [Candidatus Saccharimonadales bacterium]